MNKSNSITKLAEALAKAQAEMPSVKLNKENPFLKNKYADLGAVIETSRPVLAKYGLSISQFPVSQDFKIGVTSMLIHQSGEWLEDTILIDATEAKGLSNAQKSGVVISYLRRYAWASILGLYADEDTDGNSQRQEEIKKAKDRYNTLSDKAKKAGVAVEPLNDKMTYDEIVAAGVELKGRVDAKEKAGK